VNEARPCVLCTSERHTGMLCARHVRTLRNWLAEIVEAYALLDDVIEPGSIQREPGQRRQRNLEPPTPVRLEVVALRDVRNPMAVRGGDVPSVLGELSGYSQVVREERHLAIPTTPATVTGESALLTAHLDWICTQPWVDELHAALKAVRSALLDAIGEPKVKPIGRCPVILTDVTDTEEGLVETHAPCEGPLFPDRWGAMRVTCAACGEVWDEDFIDRAARIIENGA
jgi:hypothetical protein